MTTYVLIHGACHSGELFEDIAAPLRRAGHEVHLPTLAGNNPGDDKTIGLETAIDSIDKYITYHDLKDIVLLGHSYGGMIITGIADRMPERLRRLIYWNAFVPNDGEALTDLVPPQYAALFADLAKASPDNSILFPAPILREAFMNNADAALFESVMARLNPHPYGTMSDPISLTKNPAEMEVPKSFINGRQDTSMPQSYGWHPRLSEKLGLFRYIEFSGDHEACFTDPEGLVDAIIRAGRD